MPLVQFLLLGGLVFAVVQWQERNGSETGDGALASDPAARPSPAAEAAGGRNRTIVVDRDALLAFVQLRTQSADAAEVARAFEALDGAGRRDWIDRYAREEALVREARRLGLDRDDDLIRRRLVQKMEFLAADGVGEQARITEPELEAAYGELAESYREPAVVSFVHVFVRDPAGSADADGFADAESRARRLLGRLDAERIDPARAASLGDRFLYHRRYVERTLAEVRSHFGTGFADAIATLDVDAGRWQGPLRSDHGWHLVRLSERVASRLPTLAELGPTLERDLRQRRGEASAARGLDAIVSGYAIELEPGLEAGGR
jgi:hypothetical protein